MLLPLYFLIRGKFAYHVEEHLVEAVYLPIALWVVCSGLAFQQALSPSPQEWGISSIYHNMNQRSPVPDVCS